MSKTLNGFERLKEFYIKKYKLLFIMLVILTLISVLALFKTYYETGEFVRKDVTLKGGVSLTVTTFDFDLTELENGLTSQFPESSFTVRAIERGGVSVGFIVEATDINDDSLLMAVGEFADIQDYSLETMGSGLGESFFEQMFKALVFAFILMGIVFHFYFRHIFATLAALTSAFLDLLITFSIINTFGIRLTAGGIAAYLMLIGYSIDTSILLSTKVFKSKKNLNTAIFEAMKTGFTMSAAGIAATGISYLFTNNATLKQIMLILIIGLIIDLITTWIGNVTFLRYYIERKNVKNKTII